MINTLILSSNVQTKLFFIVLFPVKSLSLMYIDFAAK